MYREHLNCGFVYGAGVKVSTSHGTAANGSKVRNSVIGAALVNVRSHREADIQTADRGTCLLNPQLLETGYG